MVGILEIKSIIVLILPVTEETDVVVNSIADDVRGCEDELEGVLSEKFECWDCLCL